MQVNLCLNFNLFLKVIKINLNLKFKIYLKYLTQSINTFTNESN